MRPYTTPSMLSSVDTTLMLWMRTPTGMPRPRPQWLRRRMMFLFMNFPLDNQHSIQPMPPRCPGSPMALPKLVGLLLDGLLQRQSSPCATGMVQPPSFLTRQEPDLEFGSRRLPLSYPGSCLDGEGSLLSR